MTESFATRPWFRQWRWSYCSFKLPYRSALTDSKEDTIYYHLWHLQLSGSDKVGVDQPWSVFSRFVAVLLGSRFLSQKPSICPAWLPLTFLSLSGLSLIGKSRLIEVHEWSSMLKPAKIALDCSSIWQTDGSMWAEWVMDETISLSKRYVQSRHYSVGRRIDSKTPWFRGICLFCPEAILHSRILIQNNNKYIKTARPGSNV